MWSVIYTDKFGRIHDKPTDGDSPSSNNGWLYSAIAKKLGMQLDINKTAGQFCALFRLRTPQVSTPPISRDEILGLAYLGYLKPEHLSGWNFSPFPIPEFDLFDFVKQVLALVDWKNRTLKHRNTFWKEEYSQIYRFAFSVPFSDRHFINQCWGKYNPVWHLYHVLSMRKQPSDRSARLLRYLKTGQDKEAVANYFGDGHPLSKL